MKFLENDWITIPENVTSIGPDAFEWCTSLKTIEIPPGVTSIRDGTFADCFSLTTVITSSDIVSIGDDAFHGCSSLSNISFAYNTTEFGRSAFWGCTSLTSVSLSSNVQVIGAKAFGTCYNLVSINVDDTNTNFMSKDGVLFNGNGSTLIRYPCGINNDTYNIPDSVTTISFCAFYGCNKLTSITIPSTVNTMESEAFLSCSNLTTVIIEPGLTSIEACAFQVCTKLTSITIPSTVTSIKSNAFDRCTNLTNVTYYGTSEPVCSVDLASVQYLCVPIDYKSSSFCGKNVSYVNSSSFDDLRDSRNPCNESIMVCSENNAYIIKSNFASEWEKQTTGCVEYKCTDEDGPVTENRCKSTNETSLVCMNDKCVVNNTLMDEEGFVVEVKLENATNITMVEIIESFQSIIIVTGVDKDVLKIGTETKWRWSNCSRFRHCEWWRQCQQGKEINWWCKKTLQNKKENDSMMNHSSVMLNQHASLRRTRIKWNTCVDNDTLMDEKRFVVEVKLENVTKITIDEIIESIIIVTGVDKDVLKIGTETNENGEIIRVFVSLWMTNKLPVRLRNQLIMQEENVKRRMINHLTKWINPRPCEEQESFRIFLIVIKVVVVFIVHIVTYISLYFWRCKVKDVSVTFSLEWKTGVRAN